MCMGQFKKIKAQTTLARKMQSLVIAYTSSPHVTQTQLFTEGY